METVICGVDCDCEKITTIERHNLDTIKTAVLEALIPVGEELGLSFEFGRGTFTENNFVVKLEAATLDENGEANNRAADDFRSNAFSYGLEPNDFGRTFTTYSGSFTIIGAKPKNRKYPIIAENAGGSHYKFSASQVKGALARS